MKPKSILCLALVLKSKFDWFVFGFLIFLNILGVIFGYIGISTMKREEMPPFNDGLYMAFWNHQPPPENVVAWGDSTMGRIAVIVMPIIFWLAAFRLKWRVVGHGGNFIWSMLVFGFGMWIWIHSRFW
jgi:hypothetical protein